MCELLISKLMEKEKNIELITLRERLLSIVDSIDGGLIALDGKGKKIHYNSNVFEFVDRYNFEKASIYDLIPKAYIKDLIDYGTDFKNREVVFKKNGKLTYALISGKKIELGNKNLGYTIIFKKLTDVYDEVNNLSNNNNIIVSFKQMIGVSGEINKVKEKALTISKSNSTVLIQGESGTGKEILARAIHSNSKSVDKPFIAINCAAIPDNLLESELFGYEEGAFTGAKKGGKIGKFQLAENGTIFLDEIGEMPLHLQSKLLRVLQERSIERLGGSESVPINVRVIAATNKNLEELIVTKEFREDLYYRLNVIPIAIPPLRERREDIPLLLEYFLNMYNEILEKSIKGFTENATNVLMNYGWKGNVRELQNIVEYTANMAKGDFIALNDIPQRIKRDDDVVSKISKTYEELEKESEKEISFKSIDEIINENIKKAVDYYGSDLEGKTKAAKALGISRATLYRKMKEENDNKKK
jgi:transcriptional regulator with PAS, ATPase and Fis domain